MSKIKVKIILCLLLCCTALIAQIPGTIYQKVQGTIGQRVLDSNNDGFVSLTPAGFSGTDFGVNSELKMIPLPVFEIEPINDLSTGSGGGHTDIASAGTNQSVYILKRTVDGINYLVVRFRLGGASTASKGYSLLIDSDGVFGTPFSNNANNLGFDREIVFETGANGRIAIYAHASSVATAPLGVYNVNEYSQRSVALSTVGGNPDYFYDFFVPLDAIKAPNPVRFSAVTVTSAGSGVLGTISDFNGVDDVKYGNNSLLLQLQLINSFPSVSLNDLDDNFDTATFVVKTSTPSVNPGLAAGATSISGTSTEANGTIITIFKNGVSIGTATVTNNAWTISGITALVTGNTITASALLSGKTVSDLSGTSTVSAAQPCTIAIPVITTRDNGSRGLSGTAPANSTVTIWRINSDGTITVATSDNNSGTNPTTATSLGNWGPIGRLGQNQPDFNATSYVVKATLNGCTSDFSLINAGSAAVVTTPPTVNTAPILASTSSTNVVITNSGAVSANLYFYVNGQLQGTALNIAAGASTTFTYTGFITGDIVYARAIGTAANSVLSALSTSVTVTTPAQQQSTSPVITGSYAAGAGQTIRGTSTEAAGTIIQVFRNGVSIGTTTVSAFGTWQITGVTLTASQTLTATAKADSESVSAFSNTVTVTPTPPSAPTIASALTVESPTISGTGGSGLVQIFADGALIGTATPSSGNWSFPVPTGELYKGAQITARNLVSGSTSVASNIQTVTGVGGFCITLSDGITPLPSPINSGETYSLRITAITGTTCLGTPYTRYTGTVSLSGNNFISPSGTTANFVDGVLTTNVTFGGSGSTTITAINTSDPSVVGTATTNVNTSALWVGSISTDFNTAANWSGNYVPGSGADITFAPNVQSDCVLDTSRLIGNLDFNNGVHSYKFVLGANTLENRGTILNSTVNKSITSSTSSKLLLFGYGASGPVFFTVGSTIDELILNKTSSGAITIGSPIRVLSILRVVNGALTTNGNITLASTATKTAVVPTVGGTIVGNVTVEKYLPARRAFRFLSSTVNTSTSINANWQEGATNTDTTSGNVNPNPGYGTHITGDGLNGLDVTNTTNFSMFTYSNASAAWANVNNTNSNNLVAGRPYRILIRGDRSINLNVNNPTATPTTLRATGTLVVGNHTIAAASLNQNDNAYSFIGNPYHARVNMREVLKGTGFQRKVWYWNPNFGASGRGAYVSVDFSLGTTDVNDFKSIENAPNSSIVSPFAAFFVRKSGGNSSDIVFRESHKMSETSSSVLFKLVNTSTVSNIQRIALSLHESGNVLPSDNTLDGALIVFNETFDSNMTEDDMPKFSNLDEDLAIQYDNSRVSIDKRNTAVLTDAIQLGISKYRYTNYRLNINLTNYNGLAPYLVDQFLNITTPLVPGNNHSYQFSIQSSVVASSSPDRFKIVFSSPLSDSTFDRAIKLYPNPAKTNSSFYLVGVTDATVKMYNFLGQNIPLKTELVGQALQITPNVATATGVYIVSITTEGKTSQVKWIVE